MEQVLPDIRVLDLSERISGSYSAKMLAAFGAEDIKVERPGEGDSIRKMEPLLNDRPDRRGDYPPQGGKYNQRRSDNRITDGVRARSGLGL